jgi:hypothetical protein
MIIGAAVPLDDQTSGTPPEAVSVLRSQLLLQKLEVCLRNPDYFANRLLDCYDQTQPPWLLETSRAATDSSEPDVRRYPMLR